jgi:hypothetical protein
MNPNIANTVRAAEDPQVVSLIEKLSTYGLGVCVPAGSRLRDSQSRQTPSGSPGKSAERLADPRICFDRIIPDALRPHQITVRNSLFDTAMRQAKVGTPQALFHDLDPSNPIEAVRMAIINQKRWGVGSTLKCRFLDGTKTQQERAVEKARIWENYANLRIDFVTTSDEQVRVSFTPGQGSWSAVGTDALNADYFPTHQPTMNFGWLTDTTDDTEYERVVVHEFGHALGAIHEHQQPNEKLNWNVDAVYQYFSGAPNYWRKDEIDQNVLERYSPNGITATVFDEDSIMLYQFPDYLFTDGQGTPNNTQLSNKDKQLIAQMYP